MMNYEQIQNYLSEQFDSLKDWEETTDVVSFNLSAGQLEEAIQGLYTDYQFTMLTDLTAVHYPDREGKELCVVYHLHNLRENLRLRVKVDLNIKQPDVPTITTIFSGANWMERETFDFFGVQFIGHPNLTRILNVEDMDYHPMRKEYPMEDPTRIDKDNAMFGR